MHGGLALSLSLSLPLHWLRRYRFVVNRENHIFRGGSFNFSPYCILLLHVELWHKLCNVSYKWQKCFRLFPAYFVAFGSLLLALMSVGILRAEITGSQVAQRHKYYSLHGSSKSRPRARHKTAVLTVQPTLWSSHWTAAPQACATIAQCSRERQEPSNETKSVCKMLVLAACSCTEHSNGIVGMKWERHDTTVS